MSAKARFDPQPFFSVPLVPIAGPERPDLEGIVIPRSEIGREPIGVTRQFLEDAGDYHEKYTATAYFKALLEQALARCKIDLDAPVILDIGSGSGNSVFPCLELFADPHIIATDISPDLLSILARHVRELGRESQVVTVCVDATRDLYRGKSFDLVVGAAILHHLIDPADALAAALRALKSGGHAIFFEPFEAGHAILRLAYKEIIRHQDRSKPEEARALRVLEAMVRDIEVRAGSDKSAPIFEQIDDKWLFTRGYIEHIASRANASRVEIHPLHVTPSPFTDETRTNLRLAAGLGPEALGDWAWDILNDYDSAFSQDLMGDLMTAGAVLLTK